MSRWKNIIWTGLRTAIGIALLVYLFQSGALDWRALAGMTRSPGLMVAALVLLFVDATLIGWRLKVLLDPRGLHLSHYDAFRLTFIGVFFNSCLPGSTGGDLIKIYYATEGNQGRRVEVGTIILLDRACGMFALILLPLLCAPFFPEMIAASAGIRALLWVSAAVCVAMLAGTLGAWSETIRRSRLLGWVFARGGAGRFLERVYDTVHAYRVHKEALLATVLISLVAHMMAAGVAMLSSLAAHPQEFSAKMIVLIPLGFTANALPFTPGGLGVGEAAFNRLFGLAGLTGGAEALFGWRVLTILIGLLGLFFYLQGRQRFIHNIEEIKAAESTGSRPA